MPVPEAAVHEDAGTIPGQDDVGGARKSLLVDAVPVPEAEQLLAQLHLRLGVTGPVVRHTDVALGRGGGIGHISDLLSFEYLAFYAGVRVYDFPAEVNI